MSATLHALTTLRRQFEESSHRHGDLRSTIVVSPDGVRPWPLSHCLWVDRSPGMETRLGRLPVACYPSPDEALLVDNILTCSKKDLHRDERFRQLAAEAWRATLQLPPPAWELLRGPVTDHPDGGVANQLWLGRYGRSAGEKVVGIFGDPEMLWLLVLHNRRWTQETPAIRFTWNPDQPVRDPRDARMTIGFDEPASLRKFPQFSEVISLPLTRFGSTLPCDVFLESAFAIDLLTHSDVSQGTSPREPPQQRVGEVVNLATGSTSGWTWQEARERAEDYVGRYGYPGLRELARKIGDCPPATLDKAIRRSKPLTARKAEHKRSKVRRELQLSQADLNERPQMTEPGPLQTLIHEQEADERQARRRARPRTNAIDRDD